MEDSNHETTLLEEQEKALLEETGPLDNDGPTTDLAEDQERVCDKVEVQGTAEEENKTTNDVINKTVEEHANVENLKPQQTSELNETTVSDIKTAKGDSTVEASSEVKQNTEENENKSDVETKVPKEDEKPELEKVEVNEKSDNIKTDEKSEKMDVDEVSEVVKKKEVSSTVRGGNVANH